MQTSEQTLKGKRILVAEDVPVNQFLLKRILESGGAIVTLVSNGSDAVDRIRKDAYDLLLMDIQMPVMDGVAATGMIRSMEDPGKADIPIIALTANTLSGANQLYLDAGMDDYISKPYSPDKLYAVIGALLQQQEKEPATENNETGNTTDQLYDLSMMQSMSNGNDDFVREIINLFLETIPAELKALSAAGQASAWEDVARIAHKLKSAVEHMGIHSLAEPVRRLERAAEETDTRHIPGLIAQVNNTVAEVCMQLEEKSIN